MFYADTLVGMHNEWIADEAQTLSIASLTASGVMFPRQL